MEHSQQLLAALIDIDKLSEAQVKYLLKHLIYNTSTSSDYLEDCICWFMIGDDYPQDDNEGECNE